MYFHFSKVNRARFLFFVLSAIGFFSFLRSRDKQYLFLACSRFFNFFFRPLGLRSWRNARHLWLQLHQQFTCQKGARWSVDKFIVINPWMWIKLSKYGGKVLLVWVFLKTTITIVQVELYLITLLTRKWYRAKSIKIRWSTRNCVTFYCLITKELWVDY